MYGLDSIWINMEVFGIYLAAPVLASIPLAKQREDRTLPLLLSTTRNPARVYLEGLARSSVFVMAGCLLLLLHLHWLGHWDPTGKPDRGILCQPVPLLLLLLNVCAASVLVSSLVSRITMAISASLTILGLVSAGSYGFTALMGWLTPEHHSMLYGRWAGHLTFLMLAPLYRAHDLMIFHGASAVPVGVVRRPGPSPGFSAASRPAEPPARVHRGRGSQRPPRWDRTLALK